MRGEELFRSYIPGYQSMGNLNNDSNVGTWPILYGDKPLSNGQFHDPQIQRRIADAYFGYHTETVRQKMLEHEAVFKTQLHELHRLYRVQKELMDDMKMNELQKQSMAIETSLSSCSASLLPDAQLKLTSLPFPMASSSTAQPNGGAKDFRSVPDFLNGRHSQNYLVPPTYPGSSMNCEVEILECRPLTASRKCDLELHADGYINVEEAKYRTPKPHGMSHHLLDRSCEIPTSSSTKMFLSKSHSIKIDSRGDQDRRSKGMNGLTDLNQQIPTQGLSSSSLNFDGSNSNFQSHQQLCSKSQLQTSPWDAMPNSHFMSDASGLRNITMAHKYNGKECSHIPDSARSKGQTTFSQNLPRENIDYFNKDGNASYFQANQIKVDCRVRERFEGGPKHSENNFVNRLGDSHLERSFYTSKEPWENPSSCAPQKVATVETYQFLNSTSTLPQSSHSSRETWHNAGSGVNLVYQNGFYKGSGSGSGPECRPTIGYAYLNRGNETYMASCASICQNGSVKFKDLPSLDACSTKGIDLNITSVADKYDFDDRPNQERFANLPWTKPITGLKDGNGTVQSSKSCVIDQKTGPASGSYDMALKDTKAKTNLGVPWFGDSSQSKGSLSCCSPLSKQEEMDKNGRARGFDMNLPCENEDDDMETYVVNRRNLIDLNVCLANDDVATEIPTPCSHTEKTIRGFDLEASCDIDEEDMIQPKQQELKNSDGCLVTLAAEAVVGMSMCINLTFADTPINPTELTCPDTLKWFVDIVSSSPNDADKVSQDLSDRNSDSVDYFECMTLKLTEVKEEDYLPEYPKAPEPEEETGTGLYTTRTRKGQARRGRPRRDFQRDILPGITSLARHEVTEDLQTFGGLMRAAGHFWQSSLTRRTGAKRGRPRLTPVEPPIPFPTPNLASPSCSQLPPKKPPSTFCSPSPQKRKTITPKEYMNMEEDHGNLAGWGKTTRRLRRQPRRQLCLTDSVVPHMT